MTAAKTSAGTDRLRPVPDPYQRVATLSGLAGYLDPFNLVCPNHRNPPTTGNPRQRNRTFERQRTFFRCHVVCGVWYRDNCYLNTSVIGAIMIYPRGQLGLKSCRWQNPRDPQVNAVLKGRLAQFGDLKVYYTTVWQARKRTAGGAVHVSSLTKPKLNSMPEVFSTNNGELYFVLLTNVTCTQGERAGDGNHRRIEHKQPSASLSRVAAEQRHPTNRAG